VSEGLVVRRQVADLVLSLPHRDRELESAMEEAISDGVLPDVRLEARWPILTAVVCVMVLTILRPPEMRVAPRWVLPSVEIVLLAIVIARHPARVGPRSALLRAIAICVVGIVLADTLAATVRLIDVLIHGGKATNSAADLLSAGAIVWGSNVLAFALLYWLIDGGGAAARAHHMPTALDLAFPQQLSPEIAPTGWRPQFIDYLYLGLTASTAFSPTDVMPLAPWAKVAMALQSLVSLSILGLVIARAINVLT
jgi:hypothetical protein